MNWIISRLFEPSTWAGIGVIASAIATAAAQIQHQPNTVGIITAAASGLVAVIGAEKGGEK